MEIVDARIPFTKMLENVSSVLMFLLIALTVIMQIHAHYVMIQNIGGWLLENAAVKQVIIKISNKYVSSAISKTVSSVQMRPPALNVQTGIMLSQENVNFVHKQSLVV